MYKPLIVQSDMILLLETNNESYETVHDTISAFADMEKSLEYIHTYRITPLSLWNAASAGVTGENIINQLAEYSKYPVSETVISRIRQISERYGKVRVITEDEKLYLETADPFIMAQLAAEETIAKYFIGTLDNNRVQINAAYRGHIKQALNDIQFPPEDLAGYSEANALALALKTDGFMPRGYQLAAVSAFRAGGKGDHGVLVLPCGAGKTIIGIAAMAELQTETLVLTTSITAIRQWIAELLDKTNLTADQIGEYSGEKKEIKPVTISTYQIISSKNRKEEQAHFELFRVAIGASSFMMKCMRFQRLSFASQPSGRIP